MTAIEELDGVVKEGIIPDIFRMERARDLNIAIGENSKQFNDKTRGNFGELFGTIQSALELEAALAVARIYDSPNKRYPIRCLKQALDIISTNANDIPNPIERHNTIETLKILPGSQSMISALDISSEKFADELSAYFYSAIDCPENQERIALLKYLRDKRMARNEAAAPAGPTWEALNELIMLAQKFVGVVGWAYFSTMYFHDGKYTLSDDAIRPSRALIRLSRAI